MKKCRNQTDPKADVSTQMFQPGKQNLTKINLAKCDTRTGPERHTEKNKHLHPQKMLDAITLASDNSSSHYRVLKEHTPTSYPPLHRALTSRLACQPTKPPRLRGNSSSLPDPNRSPQLRKSSDSRNLATLTILPETQTVPTRTNKGRPTTNPVSTPRHQTLSGPPGRRRGSLTRHKLRTAPLGVKSPGQQGS